jgi:hypothetical protein
MRALRADRVTKRLSQAPIELRACVTRALLDRRCEPDATVLLDSICAGSDDDIAKALTIFDAPDEMAVDGDVRGQRVHQPGVGAADILCRRILDCPAPRYDALLARLYASGPTGPAERAAAHLSASQPLRAVELAVRFHRAGLRHGCDSLIADLVRRMPPRTIATILTQLDDSARREIRTSLSSALMQRPDPHLLIDALRQGGAGADADRMLLTVAEHGTASAVALLHDGLLWLAAHSDADMLVARAGTRTDIAELCEILHRGSHHRLAYLIAEQHS